MAVEFTRSQSLAILREGIDISIVGDKDLERAFKKLGLQVQATIVSKAIEKAAIPVERKIKDLAKVGKTGLLKSKIHTKDFDDRFDIGKVIQTGTREMMGIPADSKWYYPAFVEYGVKSRGIRSKSYLRKGLKLSRDRAMGVLKAVIRRGIDAFARKQFNKSSVR